MAEPRALSEHDDDFRQRAQDLARQAHPPVPETLDALSPERARLVLHELRVHQIELEMQNEELRRTQAELEASRTRYFDLYDLAPVGYFTLSDMGQILEANLTAARLLGVARSVLVKQFLSQFIAPEDRATFYRYRQELLAGAAQVCDLRMVRPDRTPFWAQMEGTIARDAGGVPLWRAVVSDVTGRKQAEERVQLALAEAQQRQAEVEALLDGAHAVLAHPDFVPAARRIVDACQRQLGATVGHLFLMTADNPNQAPRLVDMDGRPAALEPDRLQPPIDGMQARAQRSGRPIYDNDSGWSAWRQSLPPAHPSLHSILFAPLMLEGQAVGLWVLANKPGGFAEHDARLAAAFADLLAIALHNSRILAALRESQANLNRSNQDLQQFANAISHDLQEPLRTISSYLRLLEQRYASQLDDTAREFVDTAAAGAGRMQMMIRAMLDLARVDTHGRQPGPTNCQILLDLVLRSLSLAVSDAGAIVTWDPLPTVLADDVQLATLFQNLIANAIKFRQPDTTPRVHVSASASSRPPTSFGTGSPPPQDAGVWLFSVRDNGIGIEVEHLSRVFELFQRLHTPDEYPGLGMGLALCKKIVDRHNGRLWVESQLGQGSTFYFTLPASA